jgi:hypothetical protein
MIDPDRMAAVMSLCFSLMLLCCYRASDKKYCGVVILLSAVSTGHAWYLFPGGNWLGYLAVSLTSMGAAAAGIDWIHSKRKAE